MVRALMLPARLLLDLGGIEQSGNDRGRADADRYSGLYQLLTALLTGAVVFVVVAVSHTPLSMARVNA